MSIPLLVECAAEVRRLSIAGSTLSVSDFRLKRLIEPLAKAGEKAAVFGKVSKKIEDVVNGSEKDSSKNLLALGTLINAILYTQGKSDVQGEMTELKTVGTNFSVQPTPLRKLKPVMEALTGPGSGRLKIIKEAYEAGFFMDIRILKPALKAIDDSYGEIGDYMERDVLPQYGKMIIPQLRMELNLKGGKGHARRLALIYRIAGQGAWDLVCEAIENGAKPLKMKAIECLETPGKNADAALSMLVALSKSKNRDIRAAALEALAKRTDAGEAEDILFEVLESKDYDLAISPISNNQNPKVLKRLIQLAQNRFSDLLKKKSVHGSINNYFMSVLSCFEGKKDLLTQAFLISCYNEIDTLKKIKAEGKAYY